MAEITRKTDALTQKDIADTKHQQVQNLARQAGHPLLSTVEEV